MDRALRGEGPRVIAPSWPGMEGRSRRSRRPAPIAELDIEQIVDHYERNHPRARRAADHHGPLVRRHVHAAPARPRSGRRRRRHRLGDRQGRARPAAVDAQGDPPVLRNPSTGTRRSPLDDEAVPLRVHEHALPRRSPTSDLRALRRSRPEHGPARGRVRQLPPQPADRRSTSAQRPRAAAVHRVRGGPRRPAEGEPAQRGEVRESTGSSSTRSSPAARTSRARRAGRRSRTSRSRVGDGPAAARGLRPDRGCADHAGGSR